MMGRPFLRNPTDVGSKIRYKTTIKNTILMSLPLDAIQPVTKPVARKAITFQASSISV